MNLKLEVVVVPVSDVDRAKKFYHEALGFRVDVDHRSAIGPGLQASRRSELSHRAADATGIGMLDSNRHGDHAGDAGRIPGDIPDLVRHRGHAG